jgi:hypothetical protein
LTISRRVEWPYPFGQRSRALWALLGYSLITGAITYPLILHFGSAIPGDGFDGWQNYWNLWWTKTALLEQFTSPFFTDSLFFPTGVSLLFHTLNVFNGVVTLPIQLVFGTSAAYNAATFFSFIAGGLGAFMVAQRVIGKRTFLAPFAAGCIYTFAPYHMAHLLGHLQLISLEWIPFFVLYLIRAVETALPRPAPDQRSLRRSIAMAALFVILVGGCDWYYVLYCGVFTGVAVAWSAVLMIRRRRPVLPVALALGVPWLLFLLALSPLLVPMVREATQSRYMVPTPAQSRTLSADLVAFITPQEFSPWWGQHARLLASKFTATVSEHQVFLGYTTLALAAIGVIANRRSRRAQVVLWLCSGAVFFTLALGPVLHINGQTALLPGGAEIALPFAWLAEHVPFLNISRSVSRFALMLILALAPLAGLGIYWLQKRLPAGTLWGIFALLLIMGEFWAAPYPLSTPDTPAWYAQLRGDPRPGAILNLPMNWDRPRYLLYQTVHHRPLTVAYISRDDPRTLVDRHPVLQRFRHLGPDIIALDWEHDGSALLAQIGVRWVVLDRYQMPGGEERSKTESLAASLFVGQTPAYRDDRLTVYEITESMASDRPGLTLGSGWGPYDAITGSRSASPGATLWIYTPAEAMSTLTVAYLDGTDDTYRMQVQPGSAPFTLDTAGQQPRQVIGLTLAVDPP